jgi:hypothetical protein
MITTMNRYPYYFEVTTFEDGEECVSGGFSYAENYTEAAADISQAFGESNIIDVKIEIFDTYEFTFPVEKARKIKEIMNI